MLGAVASPLPGLLSRDVTCPVWSLTYTRQLPGGDAVARDGGTTDADTFSVACDWNATYRPLAEIAGRAFGAAAAAPPVPTEVSMVFVGTGAAAPTRLPRAVAPVVKPAIATAAQPASAYTPSPRTRRRPWFGAIRQVQPIPGRR